MPRRLPIPPGYVDLGNGLMRGPDGALARTPEIDDDNDAELRGRRAWQEGKRIDQCPYDAGTSMAEAWREGWSIAAAG